MVWFFLWLALGLATQVWLCFRVARTSIALAIVTFFLGPIGALYTLFKEHGEEETSVTTPFVANLVCSVLLIVSAWQLVSGLLQAPLPEEALTAAADAAPEQDAQGGLTTASMALPPTRAPALAPEPAADPLEALTSDLRSVGVAATVLRLPATSKLPDGVVSGAQLAMSSVPGAGAWLQAGSPGASAPEAVPGSTEVSAIYLRCEATAACRAVARAYMLQDPATRPRVLQNGSMLLLISNSNANQAGHLHSVVASSFRHLSQP